MPTSWESSRVPAMKMDAAAINVEVLVYYYTRLDFSVRDMFTQM